MVLALNMMDEVAANGGTIDVNRLEGHARHPGGAYFRCKGRGDIRNSSSTPLHVARHREYPGVGISAPPTVRTTEPCTVASTPSSISSRIMRCARAFRADFAATKLVEGDAAGARGAGPGRKRARGPRARHQPDGRGVGQGAPLRAGRRSSVSSAASAVRCVVKPRESREHKRSVAIDRILTGRYTAFPAFLLIM